MLLSVKAPSIAGQARNEMLLRAPQMAGCSGMTGAEAARSALLPLDHIPRHLGRLVAEVERQPPVAQLRISPGDAVEAAQVLGPGFVGDLLDIAAGLAEVVHQLPVQRALP